MRHRTPPTARGTVIASTFIVLVLLIVLGQHHPELMP